MAKTVPLGRMGVPDDIAAAVLYLATDAASWVTGQNILVAGGRTVRAYDYDAIATDGYDGGVPAAGGPRPDPDPERALQRSFGAPSPSHLPAVAPLTMSRPSVLAFQDACGPLCDLAAPEAVPGTLIKDGTPAVAFPLQHR